MGRINTVILEGDVNSSATKVKDVWQKCKHRLKVVALYCSSEFDYNQRNLTHMSDK